MIRSTAVFASLAKRAVAVAPRAAVQTRHLGTSKSFVSIDGTRHGNKKGTKQY